MVQFSSKVIFACVPDTSCMCPARILNVSHIWQRRGSYVSLAALLRGFVLARTHLVCVPDVSCACPKCVLHVFQTCLACVPDAYLRVELYHSAVLEVDVVCIVSRSASALVFFLSFLFERNISFDMFIVRDFVKGISATELSYKDDNVGGDSCA